jgi:hypothetical protein
MVEVQAKWLNWRNSCQIPLFIQTRAFLKTERSGSVQGSRSGCGLPRQLVYSLFTLALVLCGASLAANAKAVGVTVEVTDAAEGLLDSRLARRLIALELADVELPTISRTSPFHGPPTPTGARGVEIVFVRLLGEADLLTVELWAQGLLAGERRIRVAGTEEHQARRVALACAELARHVREARLTERQRVLKEHLFPNATNGAPSYSVAVGLGASVSTHVVWLPTVESVLIGPQFGVWVKSEQSVGIELFGGYYHAAQTEGPRFWSEFGLRPTFALTLTNAVGLELKPTVAAGLLDVGVRRSILGAPESKQTWSARAAFDASISLRLSSSARLRFGPEFGLLLREVGLQPRQDAPSNVRGLWIGLGLGASWWL